MVKKHFLISGRVQGVGYRRFSEKRATALNIRGMVRNLHDGRVEILAAGDEQRLAAFLTELHRGPQHAHVTSIVASELQVSEDNHSIGQALAACIGFSTLTDGEEPWFGK